jgi:hypothetical protein
MKQGTPCPVVIHAAARIDAAAKTYAAAIHAAVKGAMKHNGMEAVQQLVDALGERFEGYQDSGNMERFHMQALQLAGSNIEGFIEYYTTQSN